MYKCIDWPDGEVCATAVSNISPQNMEGGKVEKNPKGNRMCYYGAVPAPVLACPLRREEERGAGVSPAERNDRQLSLAGR